MIVGIHFLSAMVAHISHLLLGRIVLVIVLVLLHVGIQIVDILLVHLRVLLIVGIVHFLFFFVKDKHLFYYFILEISSILKKTKKTKYFQNKKKNKFTKYKFINKNYFFFLKKKINFFFKINFYLKKNKKNVIIRCIQTQKQ